LEATTGEGGRDACGIRSLAGCTCACETDGGDHGFLEDAEEGDSDGSGLIPEGHERDLRIGNLVRSSTSPVGCAGGTSHMGVQLRPVFG
jgi:hypothetical protein